MKYIRLYGALTDLHQENMEAIYLTGRKWMSASSYCVRYKLCVIKVYVYINGHARLHLVDIDVVYQV